MVREVNDPALDQLAERDHAVVVLTRSSCGACAEYIETIAALQQSDERIAQIPFLKVVLDHGGSAHFKRANPWIALLDDLPHTALFRRGVLVDRFSASTKWILLERLDEQGFLHGGSA